MEGIVGAIHDKMSGGGEIHFQLALAVLVARLLQVSLLVDEDDCVIALNKGLVFADGNAFGIFYGERFCLVDVV